MNKEVFFKKIKDINLIKILYIIASITFILPSVCYFVKNKTVLGFKKEFRFLLNDVNTVKQTIVYLIIITLLILIYFLIIKKRRELFKDIKNVMIFIFIISFIFVFTVPMFSSDVFYYLGIGRLNSKYGQNPYYISMRQYVDEDYNVDLNSDTVMQQGYNSYWSKTTVVYGAVWTLICSIISKLSLGNIDFGLLVFKLINLTIHMLNCYYIYKLSKKKIFVLLYGLNPFVLIESIVNVHNDIFMVFLLLISLYYLIKKKNIAISIIFLAIATCIKYFTILLLPFFVIYHFRKEKVWVKISKCIKYGIFFMFLVCIPYAIYIRDFNVFAGIWEQQNKVAKSLYLVISQYFKGYEKIITYSLYVFIYCFILKNILFLFNPKVKLKKEMQYNFYLILIFTFVLITNFQPWYIMWLFPLIIWQKASNIKLIVQTGLISMYANSVFLINGEYWKYGVYFYLILIIGMILFSLYNNKKKIINSVRNIGGNLFG